MDLWSIKRVLLVQPQLKSVLFKFGVEERDGDPNACEDDWLDGDTLHWGLLEQVELLLDALGLDLVVELLVHLGLKLL